MKKYITVAALLAAGSAFANAEEITLRYEISVFDGGSKNSATSPGQTSIGCNGYVNWTTEYSDISGSGKQVANLQGNGHFYINGESGISVKDDTVLNTVDGFTLVFNGYAVANWADFLSVTIGGTQYKFESTDSNSVAVYSPTGVENNVTELGKVSGVSKNTWYNYALSVLGTSYTYSAWDAAGNKVGSLTFEGASGNLTDVYEGSRFSQHWYGGALDNVGLYDGALGDKELKTLVTSEASGKGMVQSFSIVPEPSTFGLLAGLGALALVSSRRRRR